MLICRDSRTSRGSLDVLRSDHLAADRSGDCLVLLMLWFQLNPLQIDEHSVPPNSFGIPYRDPSLGQVARREEAGALSSVTICFFDIHPSRTLYHLSSKMSILRLDSRKHCLARFSDVRYTVHNNGDRLEM